MAFQPTFTATVVHTPKHGRLRVECIPPEEFRVSRRARKLQDCGYHGWQFEAYVGDIASQHPEQRDELLEGKATSTERHWDSENDDRAHARYYNDQRAGYAPNDVGGRRRVAVNIEYVRVDFDGDGIVELRRVKRVGNVILENDVVDDTEFVCWSPIRVSHRLIGVSVEDCVRDIARIRTALMRKAMDSLSQTLQPRFAVSKQAIADDDTIIDRLLDHSIGDVIEFNTPDIRQAIMPLTTDDVSGVAFQAIEQMDRRSEEASGANRHAMGIQPQAITDTAQGIDSLQSAANSRIELIARWLGFGLQEVCKKALRAIATNQDHARVVRLSGKRSEINPQAWSDDMTVSVHVGAVGDSREKKIAGLMGIAAAQEKLLMQMGPDNPVAGIKEIRTTLALIAELQGYRDPQAFFKEVPEGWQPPAAGEDPKMAEAKQKAELAQADMMQKATLRQEEMRAQQEMAKAKLDADMQLARFQAEQSARLQEAEAAHKQRVAAMQMEQQHEIAKLKIDADRIIAQQRATMEMDIARMKVEAEAELAAERLDAEMQFARWKGAQEVKIKRQVANANTSEDDDASSDGEFQRDIRFGGQIG